MTLVSAALAPGLLIAPPSLLDPNFVRSVVLLAMHNDGGALGFVVNRAAPLSVGELMALAGYGDGLKHHASPVLVGGPVQPSSVWILALDATTSPATRGRQDILDIGERMHVSSSRTELDAYARALGGEASADATRRMLLAGYSGWGPGQLESEISHGAWLPVSLDEDIVFDDDLEAKWERAYARHGLSPAGVINMRGGGEA